jgi:hypothetical protein
MSSSNNTNTKQSSTGNYGYGMTSNGSQPGTTTIGGGNSYGATTGQINWPTGAVITGAANSYSGITTTGVGAVEKSSLLDFIQIGNNKSMTLVGDKSGDIVVTFFEQVDGVNITAALEPEHDITAMEQLRINTLMSYVMSMAGSMSSSARPITYLRLHRLERHFRFRQA